MKKNFLRKVITSSVIATVILVSSVCTAFASPPAGTPSYGDTNEYNVVNWYGPWPSGWQQCGHANRHTGWDFDEELYYNDVPASVVLQTSSSSTVTLTGSMEYGFSAVAKGSLSLAVGTTWGKSYTVTINPKVYTEYILWSANTEYIRKYEYNNYSLSAASYDKSGTTKWYWSEPISH